MAFARKLRNPYSLRGLGAKEFVRKFSLLGDEALAQPLMGRGAEPRVGRATAPPVRLACTKDLTQRLTYVSMPSSSMRDLARRLLAASQTASGSHIHEAVVLIEKLRITLTKFAGPEGFASLLRRALVLASAEVPSLQSVNIGADGRLEGFEQIVADKRAGGAGDEAAVAITAHLLGLLVTFIGEPLTLRLERAAWPDILLDEEHSRTEAKP